MENKASGQSPLLQRRDFLKITAVMGGIALGGGLFQLLEPRRVHHIQEARMLMGTWVHLKLLTDNPRTGRAAISGTFAGLDRLVRLFDHRLSGGPLWQLNQDGFLKDPPQELIALIKQAREISERSAGAWDITVKPLLDAARQDLPITRSDLLRVGYSGITVTEDAIRLENPGMSVTLDGIAKGRVIDGGVDLLRNFGFEHVLVEAGGDLYAGPAPEGALPWSIGVAHPRKEGDRQLIRKFTLQAKAAATSGDYQYSFNKDRSRHHIIDPRTGRSPQELSSVTVIAPNAALADALSTTLMVLGVEDGLALLETFPGTECLMIDKNLAEIPSPDFPSEAPT